MIFRKLKKKKSKLLLICILSKALFWDTDIQQIDWERQYRAVIQRVFERGNEKDENEIIRFYGTEKVKQALQDSNLRSPYTIYRFDKTTD